MSNKPSAGALSTAPIPLPRWTQAPNASASVRLLDYAAMCAAARLARSATTAKLAATELVAKKA